MGRRAFLIQICQLFHNTANDQLGKLGVGVEDLREVADGEHCGNASFKSFLGTVEFPPLDLVSS